MLCGEVPLPDVPECVTHLQLRVDVSSSAGEHPGAIDDIVEQSDETDTEKEGETYED